MENQILNEMAKRTIRLAYFEATKGGKTIGIAALTNIPRQIIQIASGDDGRTKTTVQYHIVYEKIPQNFLLEKIELNLNSPPYLVTTFE